MRQFTKAELTETITTGQYQAMSLTDRAAFDRQLVDLWHANYLDQTLADFAADHKRIGVYEAQELGA